MIRNTFRHKVDVLRYGVITPDGGGGGKKTYNPIHTQEPCRIVPYSGKESLIFGKTTIIASHKILIRCLNPELKENDRIRYFQGDGIERNFEIKWVKVHNELEKTMRIECLEKDFN